MSYFLKLVSSRFTIACATGAQQGRRRIAVRPVTRACSCDDREWNIAVRLLLIEGESDAARMVAKGLRQESHAVDIAGDGKVGLDRALSEPYDLIILDIRLPVKDGWMVCRELRQAGLQIPILMLTASAAYQGRVKGLDLGADDYLVKPFDIDELLARVRACSVEGPWWKTPLFEWTHSK
jgi:CheY-like chemotaxis protein